MNKEKIAKLIRCVTIPPVMFSLLVIVLMLTKENYFDGIEEVLVSILCIGVIPILAYPLQGILPGFKDLGREGQRNLEFIFCFIGTTVAFVWGVVSDVSSHIFLVCASFFILCVLLTICNKCIHFRASGHASTVMLPIVVLIDASSYIAALGFTALYTIVIWASLLMKRHTKLELLWGSVISVVSFFITKGIVCLRY